MFSKQQTLLDRALNFKYKDSMHSVWRLKDESLAPVVNSAMSVIEGKAIGNDKYSFELIKKEDNRHVFRIDSQEESKSYIFKVFPLRCLRHRLKYAYMARRFSRFAYGEAIGLLKAAEKGIRVPEVYGYGSISGPLMLIQKSVLIIEFLSHHTLIGDLIESNSHNQDKCLNLLKRSIPLYVQLYKAACNHISVNTGAIMFDDKGRREEDYLLDFEYARFYSKPSLELLMYEAATLANYCKKWISEETFHKWIGELLDAVEIRDRLRRDNLRERFYYHFSTELSRKERQKIGAR